MLLLQRAHGGLDHLAHLSSVRLGVGLAGVCGERLDLHAVHGLELGRLSFPPAPLLDAEAAGHLIKPGRELRVAPKGPQVLERRQKRLLKDVARVVLVAAHAQAEAIDLLFMARQELIHRPGVAPLHLLNEFGVSGLRHASSIGRLTSKTPVA